MYAYVRFVEEIGNNQFYTIPAKDIVNFQPKDVSDFDNRTTYTAHWHDEANPENSGDYVIQILKLAESKKEMKEQLALKRPQIPKLNPSDVESEEEEEEGQTKTRTGRRELQKQKQTVAATKKEQYNRILAKYSQHMSRNVADAAKAPTRDSGPVEGDLPCDIQQLPPNGPRKLAAAPARKKSTLWKTRKPESSSDSDESVVPASKLESAKQEARFWKSQCIAERKLTASLQQEIAFLRGKVVDQLAQFQETLENVKGKPRAANLSHSFPAPAAVPQLPQRCDEESSKSLDTVVAPSEEHGQHHEELSEHAAADSESSHPSALLPFSETSDGRFHLCNEVYTTSLQAAKLFANKKPTILVREAAQLIWGVSTLAERSINGKVCPTKHGEGALPCKQLSPKKLDVVYACLSHWGQLHKVDTSAASQKVLRTLSEKIQDAKKKRKLHFEKL